jgi:hypothetical protein
MDTKLRSSRRIAALLLLGAALAGCASGPFAPAQDTVQRVEAARTPSDHQALATYYDQKAAAARASAAEHRKMGSTYSGMYAGGRGGASMAAHCSNIVRSQESMASEYEAMAAAHRQLAGQAKP